MARKKREYDDDDGRTIVDMSGVGRPNPLFLPRGPGGAKKEPAQPPRPEGEQERPWEDAPLTREERRMYILGALKAGLLIGLAFIVGLGLVIVLMLLFWT